VVVEESDHLAVQLRILALQVLDPAFYFTHLVAGQRQIRVHVGKVGGHFYAGLLHSFQIHYFAFNRQLSSFVHKKNRKHFYNRGLVDRQSVFNPVFDEFELSLEILRPQVFTVENGGYSVVLCQYHVATVSRLARQGDQVAADVCSEQVVFPGGFTETVGLRGSLYLAGLHVNRVVHHVVQFQLLHQVLAG